MSKIIRRIVIPIGLLVLMVLLIFIGFKERAKQNTYPKTNARITEITSEYDPIDEEWEHEVFVSYEVDGKSYNEKLGEYRSSFAEGQTIEIRYNPENPTDITGASMMGAVILWIMAGIALIGAVVMFFRG